MSLKNFVAKIIQKMFRISGLPSQVQGGSNMLKGEIRAHIGDIERAQQAHSNTILGRIDKLIDLVRKGNDQISVDRSTSLENGERLIWGSGRYVDKGTQILMGMQYCEAAAKGATMAFADVEFRNHSQTGEDGILWYIFSIVGTTSKTAVEMCAGVGHECNSANLIINHAWRGLLFDGDSKNIEKGRKYFASHPDTCILPPSMIQAWITAENVNELIASTGVSGEVDLFSLDVDGVDYWIWNAIDVISPRVVVLEFQAAWMSARAVTVPYKPDFVAQWYPVDKESGAHAQYAGASLPAFVKLARKKGYRLVGVNSMGYNAFFIRDDIGHNLFPEVKAEDCFTHPVCNWANIEAQKIFKNLEWEEV